MKLREVEGDHLRRRQEPAARGSGLFGSRRPLRSPVLDREEELGDRLDVPAPAQLAERELACRSSPGSPEIRIGDQPPHGGEDLDRVAALEQERIDAVAQVAADVRRRQDDRLPGGEEVRQLGGEAVVVEGVRAARLDEGVREPRGLARRARAGRTPARERPCRSPHFFHPAHVDVVPARLQQRHGLTGVRSAPTAR